MPKKTVIFIVSELRSGSTWVGYVLGSSSFSGFLGEYFRAWHKNACVPCSLCSARGRTTCEVLSGIEKVPAELAFSWAFQRTGKSLLVDNSKNLEWVGQFLAPARNYDIRFIHIIRDPRGWFSSERRRTSGHFEDLMRRWYDTNIRIKDYVEKCGYPFITVFYDEIATNPVSKFKDMFSFCGITFHSSCLEYWRFPHHGFVANGATAPVLAQERLRPAHFLTGDDAFYKLKNRKLFLDTRWRGDLNDQELHGIKNDPGVISLLSAYNRTITADGIVEIRSPISRSAQLAKTLLGRVFR